MPTATPDAQRRPSRPRRRLPWALLVPVLAFVLGLLAFGVLWLGQRDGSEPGDDEGGSPAVETGRGPAPLPAPAAPGDDTPGAAPVEDIAAPPPIPSADIASRPADDSPLPEIPGTTTGADPAAVAVVDSAPLPIEAPPPRYPRDALRRGESGEVLLRVMVGTDGVPLAVEVARGSGSRALDRAAGDSVRRWRFRPALRGGEPVEAEVQVPIRFDAG